MQIQSAELKLISICTQKKKTDDDLKGETKTQQQLYQQQ